MTTKQEKNPNPQSNPRNLSKLRNPSNPIQATRMKYSDPCQLLNQSTTTRQIFGVDISQKARSTRPRGRAEFGHDPKDIERYEKMGFVMSGNRKRRKVPQVTDEELRKAGFAVQKEVRDLREKELVARFKEMIETRKQDSTARQ
jgi:NF-kappa-B-activating protein C-terminal domain